MEAQLKELVQQRGQIKASFTRFHQFATKFKSGDSLQEFQDRLTRALNLLDKFEDIQGKIEVLVAGTPSETAQGNERDPFETAFFHVTAAAKSLIEKSQLRLTTPSRSVAPATPSPSCTDSNFGLRLPAISLPTFSGQYNDWVKFRDTFESLIHNSEVLTNIQKFYYLNSVLKGDAARVIHSLGISETNYERAWQGLKDRYEDSQTLVRHHVTALFELPAVGKASCAALRQLLDDANNHLLALKSLGEPVDAWGTLVIHLITSKLDPYTKRDWEKQLIGFSEKPSLKVLTEFLEQHCRYLDRTNSEKQPSISNKTRGNPSSRVAAHVTDTQITCSHCQRNHRLYQCTAFQGLTVSERRKRVGELKVCFNCLTPGHFAQKCTRGTCRMCKKSHHSLLHIDDASIATTASARSATPTEATSRSVALTQTEKHSNKSHVVLAIAIVHIKDATGKKHECRALLDPGSQSHFVTTDFAKRLRIHKIPCEKRVTGVGQVQSAIKHRAVLKMFSGHSNYRADLSCLIVNKITEELPNHPVNRRAIPIPENIRLADPNFHRPSQIDILISGEIFWSLLCVGQCKLGPEYPILQKTQLGWIVGGPIHAPRSEQRVAISCHASTRDVLSTQLQRFWEIEEISGTGNSQVDPLDPCEIHFQSTVTRNSDGRYIVNIPLNEKICKLGESRAIAERRFYAIERKLNRCPELRNQYADFMREYESLGHMTPVSTGQLNVTARRCFLPHHAVMKEESTTTKLRVVFDGSAKTSTGISINEAQIVGPNVQDELLLILIRFRKHNIVLSADIAKMYRQILITPEQRALQTNLWRSNSSLPIQAYELNTVTYGTASAPFLATRVLRHIGETHAATHPCASDVIRHDFYVDDLLTGASTVADVLELRRTLSTILGTAGMELRKWASNKASVLEKPNGEDSAIDISSVKDPKTLGLMWHSSTDVLQFAVKPPKKGSITKRTILGEIAQIFDPLRLIGPATIIAKVMIQQLWQLGVSWDESLPQELHSQWEEYREHLDEIRTISIPRHASLEFAVKTDLHGFCDASEKAYGACVYLRTSDRDGQIAVRLLCAKSRVAPLKRIALPRLELCGAMLLAQLCETARTALQGLVNEEFYWCDSTITLAWIKAPSSRWKTFVANRTAEIQRKSRGD